MNTIMQLRKICNHPYMFQHIEVTNRSSTLIKLSLNIFLPDTLEEQFAECA